MTKKVLKSVDFNPFRLGEFIPQFWSFSGEELNLNSVLFSIQDLPYPQNHIHLQNVRSGELHVAFSHVYHLRLPSDSVTLGVPAAFGRLPHFDFFLLRLCSSVRVLSFHPLFTAVSDSITSFMPFKYWCIFCTSATIKTVLLQDLSFQLHSFFLFFTFSHKQNWNKKVLYLYNKVLYLEQYNT